MFSNDFGEKRKNNNNGERKFDKRLSSSDGDVFMPFKQNSFVNF
jgi:hypothetical protein